MEENKLIIENDQRWDLEVVLKSGTCYDTFSGTGQTWYDRTLVHCQNICKIYEGSRIRRHIYFKSKINNEK